jgi:hypothetical protein
VSDFPASSSRLTQKYSPLYNNGLYYLFLPIVAAFFAMAGELLREKECRLADSLAQAGLSGPAYVLSWALAQLAIMALLSIEVTLLGWVAGFALFRNVSWPFFTLFYTVAGLSFSSVAAVITVLAKDRGTGLTFCYIYMMFSLFSQLLFSGGLLVYLVYSNGLVARMFRLVLGLLPAFHYSAGFTRLIWICDSHFNVLTWQWLEGHPLSWQNLTSTQHLALTTPFAL